MAFKVVIAPVAQADLENLIAYLTENWSEKVIQSFAEKLDTVLNHIRDFPFAYPIIEATHNYRKAVVSPQDATIYRIEENIIYIVHIWDTRQNPSKLNL